MTYQIQKPNELFSEYPNPDVEELSNHGDSWWPRQCTSKCYSVTEMENTGLFYRKKFTLNGIQLKWMNVICNL